MSELKPTDEQLEAAEMFLAGRLSRAELLRALGEDMTQEQLEELLDLVRTYKKAIRFKALHNDLRQMHQEEAGGRKRLSISRWLWVPAAAVIFIGLWTSGLFDKQLEYNALYEPYPYLLNMRNGESSNIQDAIEAYVSDDFEQAYSLFSKVPEDSLSQGLTFYRAISAMSIGKYQEALADFDNTSQGSENAYYQQTHWYQALAFWQTGQNKNALNTLMRIAPGDFKYEEAQKLISQLD